MLKKLGGKLTAYFFTIIGAIFLAVIISIFFILKFQTKSYNQSIFEANLNNLFIQLSNTNMINNNWLASLETENSALIHVELNNQPLVFQGSFYTNKDRKALIEQVRNITKEYFDTEDIEETGVLCSPVLFLMDGRGIPCYAAAKAYTDEEETKTLIYLQSFPKQEKDFANQRNFLIILAIIVLLFLFISSRFLIRKLLKPVCEGENKQKEFLAAASHELRSPLTIILNNARAVRTVSDKAENFLKPIEQECGRMSRLIEDMLLLASCESDKWILNKKKIEADTFFIEIYEKYNMICTEKNHILEIELQEEELPELFGDRLRLEQVFAILIDNALAYTPECSKITLKAYSKECRLFFEVEDNGKGIPDNMKSKVFERFYREEESRQNKKHFGLGLSIAKELVELHGGIIVLKDSKEGGARFVLKF